MMLSEVREIVREVASWTGISPDRIMSSERSKRVVYARDEVIRRLRDGGRSLPSIGRLVGRDHATVWHALRKPRRGIPWSRPCIREIRGRMRDAYLDLYLELTAP